MGEYGIPEVKKMLLGLFYLTGLKKENYPDALQTDVLIQFILQDLGNYTISEIQLAFRLAIKGDIEVDSNHYQAFSAPYIARIVKGYVPIRQRSLNAVRQSENALKNENEMQHTPEEIKQIKKDYIEECILKPWRYYLKTGSLTFGVTPYSIIYNTLLDDLKLITVTSAEKKEVYLLAHKIVYDKTMKNTSSTYDEYRRYQTQMDKNEKEGFDKVMVNEIKSECYGIVLKEYFKQCKENNLNLEQLILEELRKQ